MKRILLALGFLAALAATAIAQVPPPVPALPDSERRTAYSVSGTTCICSVGFALYEDGTDVDQQIQVWINGTQYLSTDPSHGWGLTSATGPLASIPRPITDAVLTFTAVQTGTVQIVGAQRPRRLSQFSTSPAVRDFNQVLTYLTSTEREQWDALVRSLRAPPAETLQPLPSAATRAGKFLMFDATGLIPQAATGAGSGNVVGPSASVNNDLACWNGTTGALLKDCVPIDVFLLIGDSNIPGQGSSASSPVPPSTARMYCVGTGDQPLADPVCSAVNVAQNANTGSMWPALAISYGRRIGLVQAGVSGSTQATACDLGAGNGNWQVTTAGSNYANALAAINAALTAYTAAGYVPTFRGIISLMGSNDASQIDGSVCTSGQYTTALTAMVANWRAATIGGTTYPHLEFYTPIIGTNSAFSDTGYSQVRAAQLAFAASDKNTTVPFTGMFSFSWRSLMQVGTAHPSQAGYNIMGTAIGAAMIPGIPANIPYQSFSANAGIGGTAPAGTLLQLLAADGVSGAALFDNYANNFSIQLRRADTNLQAPSAVQNGEVLGIFGVQSFGATTFGTTNQGALLWSATQAHTDTAKGVQACLYVTANGAATPTCRIQVGQGGAIQWSAYTAGALQSDGSGNITSTTLPTSLGGTGLASGAPNIVSPTTSVTFDVSADYAITVPLPAGYTQITNVQLGITGANGDLSAATFGLNLATALGGTAIIASPTAITVTTAAANTNNNHQIANAANINTEAFTPVAGQIFFHVTATAPAGRTGKVYVRYLPVP